MMTADEAQILIGRRKDAGAGLLPQEQDGQGRHLRVVAIGDRPALLRTCLPAHAQARFQRKSTGKAQVLGMETCREAQVIAKLVLTLRIALAEQEVLIGIAQGQKIIGHTIAVGIGHIGAVVAVEHTGLHMEGLQQRPRPQAETRRVLAVVLAAKGVAVLLRKGLRGAELPGDIARLIAQEIVLIVAVLVMAYAESRLQEAVFVEAEDMADARQTDLARDVSILIGVGKEVGLVDLLPKEVNAAQATHPKDRDAAQLGLAQIELEREVLIVGRGAGACGGETGDAVAVGGNVGAVVLSRKRPLGHRFQTREGAHLGGELVLIGIAIAEVDVKDSREGIAILGREGTREEVTGA